MPDGPLRIETLGARRRTGRRSRPLREARRANPLARLREGRRLGDDPTLPVRVDSRARHRRRAA